MLYSTKLKLHTIIAGLLLCALISSCSVSNSIKLKGTIDKENAGDIRIGMDIDDVSSHFDEGDIMPLNNGGMTIFDNGKEAVSIWSKHQDDKIGFIKITSKNFKTSDGMSVGMTLSEVHSKFPHLKLYLDEMTEEYYLAPEQLQTYLNGEPEILCLFYVALTDSSTEPDFVQSKEGDRFETELTMDGLIQYILIFQWK